MADQGVFDVAFTVNGASLEETLQKLEELKAAAQQGIRANLDVRASQQFNAFNNAVQGGGGPGGGGAGGGGGKDPFAGLNRSAASLQSTLSKPNMTGTNSFITKFERGSALAARSWEHVDKTLKSVARNFVNISRLSTGGAGSLLGMMGFGGAVVGGAVTATALASSDLAAQARQNRALGLAPGEAQAFTNDFKRFGLDIGDVENVANARNDIHDRWIFSGMGLTDEQIQNLPATELAARADKYLAEQTRQANANGVDLNSMLTYTGLGKFFSMDQARAASRFSDEQHDEVFSNYRRDVPKLAATEAAQNQATENENVINNAWDQARTQIETAFMPLTPTVVQGIKTFAQAVSTFAQSDQFQQDVKDAKQALDQFTAFVNDIVDDLNKLHLLKHPLGTITHEDPDKQSNEREKNLRAWMNHPTAGGITHDPRGTQLPKWLRALTGWVRDDDATGTTPTSISYADLEKQYGLPPGLLGNVEQQESASGRNVGDATNDSTGPAGPFQFTQATAARYGVTDRMNEQQSAVGAAKDFRDLLRKYHGNLAEAIASYDGFSGLDADIKRYGENGWISHAPTETQKYLLDTQGRGADFSDSVRKQLAGIMAQHAGSPDEQTTRPTPLAARQKDTALKVSVDVHAPAGFNTAVAVAQVGYSV